MIKCPECKSEDWVPHNRVRQGNANLDEFRCKTCGHKFTREEACEATAE